MAITGASGFIGNALIARLRRDGYEVEGLSSEDGDIAAINLDIRLENFQPDHVIHLAGRTFIPDSWKNPLEFYRVNVLGTVNVADYCRRRQIDMIYVSAYVYGKPASLPISEDSAAKPNNPYAHSKFLGEEICRQYAAIYGLPMAILRPFNVYGPGQSSPFLIPEIVFQALHNDRIEVDSLLPRRDYIYIDDLTEAISLLLCAPKAGATYNIGSGESVSVQDIIDAILLQIGSDKSVYSRNIERANEVIDVVADISRFCLEFEWRPKFTLSAGIEAVLAAS